MFICDYCHKCSKSGEPCNKVVTEIRNRVYKNDEGIIIGKGWEIVKEEKRCNNCKDKQE